MVIEALLFMSLFHHKDKKPVAPEVPAAPTQEQKEWNRRIEIDHKVVADAIEGARAFEADKNFAQYERPEIDAFERQLFKCTQDTDDKELDKDVDTLIDLGNAMQSMDDKLHHRQVI